MSNYSCRLLLVFLYGAILPKEKSFFGGNDNWLLTTIYSIIQSDLELNFVIRYNIQKGEGYVARSIR